MTNLLFDDEGHGGEEEDDAEDQEGGVHGAPDLLRGVDRGLEQGHGGGVLTNQK